MRKLIPLIALTLLFFSISAQEKKYKVACIGFYNVENLFDTIDQPEVRDEEFTPAGPNAWTGERYRAKLEMLAHVIHDLGTELTSNGAIILGLSEIENRSVIEDLVAMPELKARDYGIVHYDSPDRRGVDVGLIYQKAHFRVSHTHSYRLRIAEEPDFLSRDQLVVSGYLDNELIHLIVNHWPSRRGGEQRSRPLRNAAADLNRHIVDSLLQLDPDARVIVMGDLNDDPVNQSVRRHLKATADKRILDGYRMYNPMEELYFAGIGSLAWRDSWNLFDQIIVSHALAVPKGDHWSLHNVKVYNKDYLKQKTGSFRGYPFRTYAGGSYLGGYSDHFPVYAVLIKPE